MTFWKTVGAVIVAQLIATFCIWVPLALVVTALTRF